MDYDVMVSLMLASCGLAIRRTFKALSSALQHRVDVVGMKALQCIEGARPCLSSATPDM